MYAGAAVAPFVETPTFVLNSKYDLWQAAQIIGAGAFHCGSNISDCPEPMQTFWVDYGMDDDIHKEGLNAPHCCSLSNHGLFCYCYDFGLTNVYDQSTDRSDPMSITIFILLLQGTRCCRCWTHCRPDTARTCTTARHIARRAPARGLPTQVLSLCIYTDDGSSTSHGS